MKKKYLMYLLCFLLLLSGVSCATTPPESEPEEQNGQNEQPGPNYEEGVYSIQEEEFDDHGWKPMATVVVDGDEITKVYYDEINQEDQLKSFDQDYLESWKDKSGKNLLTAGPELSKALKEQQDPDKVDTVSGATSTSEKFKELTVNALEDSPQPKKENGYYDGIFGAQADYDERGWKAYVSVIIEDGKITNAYYDEMNKETGKLKSNDQEYLDNWKENSGTNLQLARPKLIQDLISKQKPSKVDTVSGATSTTTKFKDLIDEALAPFE